MSDQPLTDSGNTQILAGMPVQFSCGTIIGEAGRIFYVWTFRQGGFTFSFPFNDAAQMQAFARMLVEHSGNIPQPSGLIVPSGVVLGAAAGMVAEATVDRGNNGS